MIRLVSGDFNNNKKNKSLAYPQRPMDNQVPASKPKHQVRTFDILDIDRRAPVPSRTTDYLARDPKNEVSHVFVRGFQGVLAPENM